jgi:hypothetical protein
LNFKEGDEIEMGIEGNLPDGSDFGESEGKEAFRHE